MGYSGIQTGYLAAGLAQFFEQSGNQAAGTLPFDWVQSVYTKPLVGPLAILGGKIGTFSDASTGFEISAVAQSQNNPNTAYSCYVFPVSLYNTEINGQDQFVQATFFEQANLSAGIALLFKSDSGIAANGYYITKDGFVERVNNNVVTEVNAVSFGVFAQNDVMRVSVDIQPTQNVFTIRKNGVLFATVTDSLANRLTSGCPGFFGFTMSGLIAGAFSRWKNFSAGLGA